MAEREAITKEDAIVITGAAGFIGSCMVGYLNKLGFQNLILVDEFERGDKIKNWEHKKFSATVERDLFFDWLHTEKPEVKFIFHFGARTDTTEFDYEVHQRLNVEYSQDIWNYCIVHDIPLVYASSAATYGAGELGYSDGIAPQKLQPLNPYGVSKNEFDKWAMHQISKPPFWAGLKFFNVYGPNEYHKERMASVIFHSFNQIKENGFIKLFKSHRADVEDGQQLRDFVYVKDVLKICFWLMKNQPRSTIYNIGTGQARSFYDLAKATFAGLDKEPDIRFIDMPEDIRDKYQYFTEADIFKLRTAGYKEEFYTLENGVADYVRHYLTTGNYY
ncbi:MAG: ADP-glyceromanno-heptose 6-epimerase [Agriterribacter sp.]